MSRFRRVVVALVACAASVVLVASPAQADALYSYCDDGRDPGYEHYLEGYAAYAVDGQYHNWTQFAGRFSSGFHTHINDNNDLDIWFHRNGVQMFHEWDNSVADYQWKTWWTSQWTLASDHEVVRWKGVFDLPLAPDTHCNVWAET